MRGIACAPFSASKRVSPLPEPTPALDHSLQLEVVTGILLNL